MSVIVIGAGIAGLTAARDLSHKQISTVVLEAQDRIGGRILTKDGVDYGASWIHDLESNAFFPVAQELRLKLAYDIRLFYYSQGKVVSPYIVDKAVKLMSKIANSPVSQSLYEFSVEATKGYPAKEAAELQQVMQFMEHWTGLSWHEQAARSSEVHTSSPDAFNLSGNINLVNWVKDAIDMDYVDIKMNSPIRRISQTKEGEYAVTTEDGRIFRSSAVICTIPVGAMKIDGLFDLDLPRTLRTAIKESVMASLGKVVLKFSERWWDDVPDRMEIFSRPDAISKFKFSDEVQPGDQPVFVTNVHKFTGKPWLICLIAGPLTYKAEANPDQAFDLVKPALEQIRGDKTKPVPEPVNVSVTDWTQNRFFKGSYCGAVVNQDEDEIYSAFIRGHQGLRFAGEHATDDQIGTMHAAYVSGQREATNVIAALTLRENLSSRSSISQLLQSNL